MKTAVTIAGVTFQNPVMTGSGTFGSGMEYSEFVDLNRLGAVVTKGVANVPWPGNPTPRVAEVSSGMLNAIGLQNPGIDVFIERYLAFLKQFDTKVIVNVCGKTAEDYVEVVERLADTDVSMLEINVSCPNVKEGAIAFGQKADALFDITSKIKKAAKQPVIMKLSPNVTDITEMARAAEAAQHADGHEDRHRAQALCAGKQDGRHVRPCDQADRGADGMAVRQRRKNPDHRHGRHRDGRGRHRVYDGGRDGGCGRRNEFCESLRDGADRGRHRGVHGKARH